MMARVRIWGACLRRLAAGREVERALARNKAAADRLDAMVKEVLGR